MTRQEQLQIARQIADEIIHAKGTATTGDVHTRLVDLNLIDTDTKKHWLASVFRRKKYKWTGEYRTGVGHDELAMVWKFN